MRAIGEGKLSARAELASSCYDGVVRLATIMFDLDNTLCDRDAAFGRWLKQFAPFLDHDAIAELQRMDDHGRTDRNELCRNIASRYPALGSAPSLWKQMRDGIAENVSFDQRR